MSKPKEIAPKLRFPEFCDFKWEITPLRALADKVTERNRNNAITRVFTNSAIEGVVDQGDYFDRSIANQSNLTNYFVVEPGDYVYNPRISISAPVGPVSKNKLGTGVMSPLYTVFRFRNAENDFYEQFFLSSLWHAYIKNLSNTGARYDRITISDELFMNMPLPCASPEEQRKIAACLSSIDHLIACENRKLEGLKKYKRGLMQKLLPPEGETLPEWRFPEFRNCGRWENKKLSEIGCFIRGFSYSSEDTTDDPSKLLVLRSNNIVPFGETDYINGLQYVDKSCKEEQKLLPGDITICMANGSKSLVGKASCYDGNYAGDITVGAFCGIFRSPLIITRYLFQTGQYRRMLYSILNGGDGAIANLREDDLLGLSFAIPADRREQQKIVGCLSEIDSLITAQSNKVEALKAHKKGLVWGLFPSLEEADI